ncbi:MAG TPA: pilus assembly protein MshP [Gammaproteobacteria bacterium]|nr:pilus assembly protein MshP [Gammaproteobacteria bacterium]
MNERLSNRRGQRGATLVVAVFLLVVLAVLGAFAVRLTLMQQQTVSSALLASQAFHAARSGIAWGAHRALNGGSCATTTLALTEGGAAGFSVDVSCAQSTHLEGGATIEVFVIEALAEWGAYGQADYVSRRLEAKITDET